MLAKVKTSHQRRKSRVSFSHVIPAIYLFINSSILDSEFCGYTHNYDLSIGIDFGWSHFLGDVVAHVVRVSVSDGDHRRQKRKTFIRFKAPPEVIPCFIACLFSVVIVRPEPKRTEKPVHHSVIISFLSELRNLG